MKRSSVGKSNGIPVRHRWVFEVLQRAGCSVASGDTGVYSVQLSPGLVDMVGREEVRIAFQRRLAARDGVELASPGSWFHDQLVRYTRERGRYTISYLRPRPEASPERILNHLKLRRPVYRPTARNGHFGRTGAGFTWEKTARETLEVYHRVLDQQ